MTERERRAAYAGKFEKALSDPIVLDLIVTAQSIGDPSVRCGFWDCVGHIIQSAKEPAPREED